MPPDEKAFANVVAGTTTWSSWSPPTVDPAVLSSPTTVSWTPPIDGLPDGIAAAEELLAVVDPMTATGTPPLSSAWVKKRPGVGRARPHRRPLRGRADDHVVQFWPSATTLCDEVETGATAATSGATSGVGEHRRVGRGEGRRGADDHHGCRPSASSCPG